MDVNDFVAKLKFENPSHDVTKINEYSLIYEKILEKLAQEDSRKLSLNILCMIARNLDKSQEWSKQVEANALVSFSIQCLCNCKELSSVDEVKLLGSTYRIHRFAFTKKCSPEFFLNLSQMIFTPNELIKKHIKTYWAVLFDRIMFTEYMKIQKFNIAKLITGYEVDIQKLISNYSLVSFCMENLSVLLRCLHSLYGDLAPRDLNELFVKIFEGLSKHEDVKNISQSTDKKVLNDLYVKINDCVLVVVDASVKNNCETSALMYVTRFALSILGFNTDLYHCIQTFYVNTFSNLLTKRKNTSVYMEIILKECLNSVKNTEKLGYVDVAKCTYPYINRIFQYYFNFIADKMTEEDFKELLSPSILELCFKITLQLTDKLKTNIQLTKCDNCIVKNSVHDVVMSCFAIVKVYKTCLKYKLQVDSVASLLTACMDKLRQAMVSLKAYNCTNYERLTLVMQTDAHNIAIMLYKNGLYNTSLYLFDFYIKNQLKLGSKSSAQLCRALYNKAICCLDMKLYKKALEYSYLSYALCENFAKEGDKYMGMVISVKSKFVSEIADEVSNKDGNMQMITVLDVYTTALQDPLYSNLRIYLDFVSLGDLLVGELEEYFRVWPSVQPVTAVLESLYNLHKGRVCCTNRTEDTPAKNLAALCDSLIKTATKVRTIEDKRYEQILLSTLDDLRAMKDGDLKTRLYIATLELLRGEMAIASARDKHGWRVAAKVVAGDDNENVAVSQTLIHEYEALKPLEDAVLLWSALCRDLLKDNNFKTQHRDTLSASFDIALVSLHTLSHFVRVASATEFAVTLVRLAHYCGRAAAYLSSLSLLLRSAKKRYDFIEEALVTGAEYLRCCLEDAGTVDMALEHICDIAIYKHKMGSHQLAAKLLRYVQKRLADEPSLRAGAFVCSLLETEALLCDAVPNARVSTTAGLNFAQRRVIVAAKAADQSGWSTRRLSALRWWSACNRMWAEGAHAAMNVGATRRAFAACSARPAPAAATHADAQLVMARAATALDQNVQVKIDTVKSIMEAHTTKKIRPDKIGDKPKNCGDAPYKAKLTDDVESILDTKAYSRGDKSPGSPIFEISCFKMAEYLFHVRACDCYACRTLNFGILALQTSSVEASMYFRQADLIIAQNYFNGCLKMFDYVRRKITYLLEDYEKLYDDFILELIKDNIFEDLSIVEINLYLEYANFEVSRNNLDKAKDCLNMCLGLHKNLIEAQPYLKADILNLTLALHTLKGMTSKKDLYDLEKDLYTLKLSPAKNETAVIIKTPEAKPILQPKKEHLKVTYTEDELPQLKKRLVKLNLDDTSPPKETRAVRNQEVADYIVPNIYLDLISPEPIATATKKSVKTYTRSVAKDNALLNLIGDKFDSNEYVPNAKPKLGSRVLLFEDEVKKVGVEYFKKLSQPLFDSDSDLSSGKVENTKPPVKKCARKGRVVKVKTAKTTDTKVKVRKTTAKTPLMDRSISNMENSQADKASTSNSRAVKNTSRRKSITKHDVTKKTVVKNDENSLPVDKPKVRKAMSATLVARDNLKSTLKQGPNSETKHLSSPLAPRPCSSKNNTAKNNTAKSVSFGYLSDGNYESNSDSEIKTKGRVVKNVVAGSSNPDPIKKTVKKVAAKKAVKKSPPLFEDDDLRKVSTNAIVEHAKKNIVIDKKVLPKRASSVAKTDSIKTRIKRINRDVVHIENLSNDVPGKKK